MDVEKKMIEGLGDSFF